MSAIREGTTLMIQTGKPQVDGTFSGSRRNQLLTWEPVFGTTLTLCALTRGNHMREPPGTTPRDTPGTTGGPYRDPSSGVGAAGR